MTWFTTSTFLPLQLPLQHSSVRGCLGRAGACWEPHGCRTQHFSQRLLRSAARPPWLSQRGDAITCLLIPTGKLDPLVARLMGATTATLVGEGADCRFLGGKAGGGLQDTRGIDASVTRPSKRLSEASGAGFAESLCLARLKPHSFLSKTVQKLFNKVMTNTDLRTLSQGRSCAVIYFFKLGKELAFQKQK